MRYLQQFESYGEFYHRISGVDDLIEFITKSDYQSFSSSEFNQIKNQVHQVQFMWETSIKDNNSKIIVTGASTNSIYKNRRRQKLYQISKLEDEWFYVIGFDILDNSGWYRHRYYKCDQLQGVLRLISDFGDNRYDKDS
jgi:translation elongation factor EF-1alpha